MQPMNEMILRRGFGSGVGAATVQAPSNWRERVRAVVRGPWARPLGRAGLTLSAVVFLSWLGARSAESTSPASGEPDPELNGLVTVAALPAPGLPGTGGPLGVVPSAAKRGADAGANDVVEGGARRGVLSDGRIVLNEANAEELCLLPGVGPARADKIIALRTRLGRFRSLQQLLRVRGIGPRTLKRLRPLLVLDAPGDSGAG